MKFSNVFNNLKRAIKEGVIINVKVEVTAEFKKAKAVKESTKKAVIRVNGKIVNDNVEVNQEVIREDETIKAETVVTAKKTIKSKTAKIKGYLFAWLSIYFTLWIMVVLKLVGLVGWQFTIPAYVISFLIYKAAKTIIIRNYWF